MAGDKCHAVGRGPSQPCPERLPAHSIKCRFQLQVTAFLSHMLAEGETDCQHACCEMATSEGALALAWQGCTAQMAT